MVWLSEKGVPGEKKKMKRYEIELKGVSPYLMHAFGMEGAMKKSKKSKIDAGSPEIDAEKCLYIQPDGVIYVPATQVHGCLMEAGKQFKIPGKGKATFSKPLGSQIVVSPDAIRMEPQAYVIDSRPVVVPSTKGRVMRYRPKFEEWGLKFVVDISDERVIPPSVLKEILEYGGGFVGVGDFRPGKKGPFGRFQVVSFKEV